MGRDVMTSTLKGFVSSACFQKLPIIEQLFYSRPVILLVKHNLNADKSKVKEKSVCIIVKL